MNLFLLSNDQTSSLMFKESEAKNVSRRFCPPQAGRRVKAHAFLAIVVY